MTREELEALEIRQPSREAFAAVKAAWDGLAKPLDSMGRFEELTARIGAILGTKHIDIRKKAVIVLCADHGIVEEGVSQSGQEVTLAVATAMGKNRSSVGRMAAHIGADVIPVDIGINYAGEIPGVRNRKIAMGTRNFRKEPAMTEQQALDALQTGIELVSDCKEQGYQLLAVGEMGIGNTTASSAVAAALLGISAEEITGRGAGLSDAGLVRKRQVIAEALEKYHLKSDDALGILSAVGGLDLAGMAGVFLGGALYQLPVVMDGVISAAAALAAERLKPGVRDYLLPSHMSREPAAQKLLQELHAEPVIDASLALGEGTGAVMMFALLDLAMALYQDRTSFFDMELEPYRRF